jgi:hypothetical protein
MPAYLCPDEEHVPLLLAALALWLATPEAKGQVLQEDAWTAANWQALIETARALAQRGTISQRHAAGTDQVHRPNRAKLFAKYDKAGQRAAFRRASDQYLNAHRAALKAILTTERPPRQPSAPPLYPCPKPSSPLYEALMPSIPSPATPPRSKSSATP